MCIFPIFSMFKNFTCSNPSLKIEEKNRIWQHNFQSSAFNSIPHSFLHPVLITCPYHLSLPLLMNFAIGSTSTSLLNSWFVLLSFNEIPHTHLIICISATSTRHQLARPSLNSISHADSDTTVIHSTFHLQWGSSGCQEWQKLSELHPSISDSRCSSKIRSTISIKSVSQITKALYTVICFSIHHYVLS